jgi:hypothetical protein
VVPSLFFRQDFIHVTSPNTITFDKEYWKDKTCFNCGEKGHPSSSCTKVAIANDDDSASIAQSVKKLAKDTKNLKKAFTQLQKTSE